MASASQVAHEGLAVHNPLPLGVLDDALERLELAPGATVLDIGSGNGELLRRIVERWPATSGVGVDVLRADPVHPSVELRCADAATIDGTYDLVCCVGSIHAIGGFPDGYARLAQLAPVALVGDGYWRHEPDPAYLEALGATVDELPDRAGLRAAARAAGWSEVWSAESSTADLTVYEEALLANAERHLVDHPDRDDVRGYAAAIARWRAAPGGTDTLGFALSLLRSTA